MDAALTRNTQSAAHSAVRQDLFGITLCGESDATDVVQRMQGLQVEIGGAHGIIERLASSREATKNTVRETPEPPDIVAY